MEEMTPSPNMSNKWEKEFDKLFPAQSSPTGYGLRYYFSTKKRSIVWDETVVETIENKVKSFISNLLSSQRAEIKKMVEGMSTPAIANQEEIECCNCGEDLALESYDWLDEGYKMAITDVLSALEK